MALEAVPPKYAQLVTELKRRIEAGTYPPGSLMPSENQLIQEFGVSRPTVVAALRVLREEDWVESRQGKGRYVRGRPVLSTLEQARRGQIRLTSPESDETGVIVQAVSLAAPNRIATLLGLAPRSKVFLRKRVTSQDGEPSEIVSWWLPVSLSEGTDLTSTDPLSESLDRHLRDRKGVRFDHVVEHITARQPRTEETKLLMAARRVPLLVVYATVRDATGKPLVVIELALPADRHELEDAYPLR